MLGGKLESFKRRFNLLLLEENEYYFEDYGAVHHAVSDDLKYEPIPVRKRAKGRLHICSKSVFFDPDDMRMPVIRFPLRDMVSMRHVRGSVDITGELVEFRCKSVVSMRPMGRHEPYMFKKLDPKGMESEFIFSLPYSPVEELLSLGGALRQIETDKSLTRSKRKEAVQSFIAKMEAKIQFDKSWFVDFKEQPLFKNGALLASQVTPLVITPGRYMLTDRQMYFQPLRNVTTHPVHRYDLRDIGMLCGIVSV